MGRSNKADKADESILEQEIARIPKKTRIRNMLLAAYREGRWLTIRDLGLIASRGYIYNLMKEFIDNGWVKEKQLILKGRRTTGWQGTKKLVSFVSSQEEGQPARGVDFGKIPKRRALRKRLEKAGKKKKTAYKADAVKVLTKPTKLLSDYIGVDSAYTEKVTVTVILDPAVADRLRQVLNPPSKQDRADQYHMNTEPLSVILSGKDKCVFILKKTEWAMALGQICIMAGISRVATNGLIQQVEVSIPDGYAQTEFPIFMQHINDLEVSYEMRTEILDADGEPTGFVIVSNINRSMLVDFEVLGKVYAVDSLLSVMSAMQHSVSVAYAHMEIEKRQEAEEREKQRKETEEAFIGKQMKQKEEEEDDSWKNMFV